MTDANVPADREVTGDALAPYDHVRPAHDLDLTPGVYRVVGASDDAVTLLRVADGEGRRRNTGEVTTVERAALGGFERAANPDENRSLGARASGHLRGLWWSVRVLARTVVDRPVPGTAALALVVVGLFGDAFVSLPDGADTVLFLAGFGFLWYLSRT